MKILVLTMAHKTDDPVFINYKRIWDSQIETQKYPIDVLYLYTDETITDEYAISGNNLISKYPENYWDALLVKVLNGFDYFIKSDYDLVFKTNLSTIINYDLFYKYCESIDTTRKYVYDGKDMGNFCSGAGMLLNKAAAQLVLDNKNLFSKSWTDDIFIGHILCDKYGIKIKSDGLNRYDIWTMSNGEIDGLFSDAPSPELVKTRTHIRVKIRKGSRDIEITNKVYELLQNI